MDEAAKKLNVADPELLRARGTDLQILEYFRAKKGNFAELTNWLHHRMQPTDDRINASPLHTALTRLALCKIFYTTNYDDFLERALQLSGRAAHVVRSEQDMGQPGGAVEVVKFHGDFNSPDHMVLSESHYEKRLLLDTALDLKLRSDILGRAILFVGYSFRDSNVAYLFRHMKSFFGPLPASFNGKRAYIVVSEPSDFEMQLFLDRNIEVVPVYGADRGASAAAVLAEMTL